MSTAAAFSDHLKHARCGCVKPGQQQVSHILSLLIREPGSVAPPPPPRSPQSSDRTRGKELHFPRVAQLAETSPYWLHVDGWR
ncbi:hypothetical protein JOB18_042152 [Solea senegalensis]|uniref:Uncharacterized protein n=1 Tax=Solea senegalensis TaxID=28829 RepID=A0AAV6RLK0_SOLSE|nr:hypothetical protein JOB18_042152 [Solea senegalensis]